MVSTAEGGHMDIVELMLEEGHTDIVKLITMYNLDMMDYLLRTICSCKITVLSASEKIIDNI